MKKLTVILTSIAFALLMFASTFSFAYTPAGGSSGCEYQFNVIDATTGACNCLWSGISGEFCTCSGC